MHSCINDISVGHNVFDYAEATSYSKRLDEKYIYPNAFNEHIPYQCILEKAQCPCFTPQCNVKGHNPEGDSFRNRTS